MTLQHWQALTTTTDTPSQGTHHKVSGEPTPHDKSLRLLDLTPCTSLLQINTQREIFGCHAHDLLITMT